MIFSRCALILLLIAAVFTLTACYDLGEAERDAHVFCRGHEGIAKQWFDSKTEEIEVTCVDGSFGVLDEGFDDEPFTEPSGDVE